LLSVSGLDDLAPDAQGRVDDRSPLRTSFTGFSHIGVPVRQLIEASGVGCSFVYLGTVYGPGKSFAEKIFPQLATGRLRLPGGGANRMAVVHVEDAARALVHIALMEGAGRSFVIADGNQVTLAEFMTFAAECLGGPHPKSAPLLVARLVAGRVLFETVTRDTVAYPRALLESGFVFRYPTYRDGLPPSIAALGVARPVNKLAALDSHFVFAALSVMALGAFFAENFLTFPLSVPFMRSLASGAPILDMRLGYTPSAAYRFFDALGRPGRIDYLVMLWTVDLVLPALFGSFLSAAVRRGVFRAWFAAPLLGSLFDYAENTAISILLAQYPVHNPTGVYIASALTCIKLGLYTAGVLMSLAGVLIKIWRTKPCGKVETQRWRVNCP